MPVTTAIDDDRPVSEWELIEPTEQDADNVAIEKEIIRLQID